MAKRLTIRDVAKLAEVSVATVSAVINNTKYVSPELEQRVLQAIEELNYKPNLVARSLKMQETKTIGLVFSNITSPIWPPLVRTTQIIAHQSGFSTFLVTTDENSDLEQMSLQSLLAKRVDGILIAPAVSKSYEHIQSAARTVSVIAIERHIPDVECLVTNNEEISYQATRHLVEHGYQRIGLVTIPSAAPNTADRIAGYRRALNEHGLYDESLIREVDFVGNTAFSLAYELLSNTSTDAVFSTSESTAMGVVRAANELGRVIPDDLAIFAYDDVPWMEIVSSPLSTVRQPIETIAQRAITRLLELIEGGEPHDNLHVIDSSLVIRQSCGCQPNV